MELKEYFKILKKNSSLFFGVAGVVILVSFAYFFFRPVSYTTSITLNITRNGSQETNDYKYDGFYRLQADEKFAETLVQWLASPRIVEDIYKEAGIDTQGYSLKKLARSFKAEKLSSQVVAVSFSSPNNKISQNISRSISEIISKNIQNLDKDQSEKNWFEIISQDPVIRMNEINMLVVMAVVFFAIFLAFWVTMIKYYLE